MPVIGRDEPLGRVGEFIRAVPVGVQALVVEGEPGIGKTTVWQWALEAARDAGFRIVATRPAESETSLAYAGLADLLEGVELDLDALPGPQARALETALLLAEPEQEPDPRSVFTALGHVLRTLADDAPLVVAIDDRQWLDASTLRALDFVSRRLASSPVGIVATQRPETDTPADWQSLRLGPLSAAALHTVVKERTGVSLPRSTILRVHDLTGGNPFFALEVARALIDAGVPAHLDAWPVPDDLRDLVAGRIERLPARLRAKLVHAAAAGRGTVENLSADELAVAERAGIVMTGRRGGLTFAHPLYASAIYTRTGAAERRAVHAALAAEEEDLEARARHTALAAAGPDTAVADLLDEASVRARRRGAPDVAAELAERAAALTPPDERDLEWRRSVAAAEHRFHAGDLERAQAALRTLVAVAEPGASRSRARRILAEVDYRLGALGEALEQLRASTDDARRDPAALAAAEIDLCFVLSQSFTSFAESSEAARRAVAAAEALGDRGVLAAALAAEAFTDLVAHGGADLARLERALALENVEASTPVERRPTFVAAGLFAYIDELDRARELLHALRDRVEARGEETQLPTVLSYLALVECRGGHPRTAAAIADEARALALQFGDESDAAFAAAFQSLAAAFLGAEPEARAAAAEATRLATRSGWQMAAFHARTALAHLELALGRPEAVLALVVESLAIAESELLVEPARWPYLADAIEALIAVGELDRAARLTELLHKRARALDRTSTMVAAARCRALLRATTGDVAAALNELAVVDELLDRVAVPLEAARTLIVRGQLERRRKQKRAARDSLEQAAAMCDAIGAALWAQRARSELARVRGVADDGELTASEARVAELAATGLTNREIAAAAFMSQKTVEANLSRVYRKLGIRSRAELGLTLAATHPPEPAPRTAG